MYQLFIDFEERMTFLYNEIRTELDRLPDEAFDWSPAKEMGSIAVLVAHTAGAAQYWTCNVPFEAPSDRVRPSEFETKHMTKADLIGMLDESLEKIREAVRRLSADNLHQSRHAKQQDRQTTVSWSLLHAIEHTATHVGHIQMMRHYWQHTHTVK